MLGNANQLAQKLFAIGGYVNDFPQLAIIVGALYNNIAALFLCETSTYCNNRTKVKQKGQISVTKAAICNNMLANAKTKRRMFNGIGARYNSKTGNCSNK
jgi:hypothetical protein